MAVELNRVDYIIDIGIISRPGIRIIRSLHSDLEPWRLDQVIDLAQLSRAAILQEFFRSNVDQVDLCDFWHVAYF